MQRLPHIRLVVHPARRSPGHTDWPGTADLPVPSLEAILDAAAAHAPTGITWLGGGEPTLRPDLPLLIERLAAAGHTVGLDSDGLALVKPRVLQHLHAKGLRWLRLPLHSVLPDAHDWVEGTPGSARRVKRAATAARAVGLKLAGTVQVSRSTVPHLVDTVRALAALGARTVHLRRPRRRGAAGKVFVTVSPRLGLTEPYLEAAVARGRDAGIQVRLDGFPRCTAPRVRRSVLVEDNEPYVVPEPLSAHLQLAEPPAAEGCPRCPGPPLCSGAPGDYVDRFGRLELDDPGLSGTEREHPRPLVFGETPPVPPPRGGRSPATRLRFAVRQSALPDLGGDPTAGMGRNPTTPLRLRFAGSSRDIKVEMVRLSQEGPAPVVVEAGTALAQPDAHGLLRELLRLGFTEITVHGDVTALGKRSRRSLARLKGITRFVAQLWAPSAQAHDALAGADHHARTLAALAHLEKHTGAQVGVAGLLPVRPPETGLDVWSTAWSGGLPGTPSFHFPRSPDAAAWAPIVASAPEPVSTALQEALETSHRAE